MPLYYNETTKKEQAPVSAPVPFYDFQCLRQSVPVAFPLKKGSMLLQYFRQGCCCRQNARELLQSGKIAFQPNYPSSNAKVLVEKANTFVERTHGFKFGTSSTYLAFLHKLLRTTTATWWSCRTKKSLHLLVDFFQN